MRLSSGTLLLLSIAFLPCFAHKPAGASPPFELRVISSRPDTVSGDTALVEFTAPPGSKWSAKLDGRNVNALFKPSETAVHLVALLDHIKAGTSVLDVRASRGSVARLTIVNHPLSGPIFSGAQQHPYICETIENGLGPALDSNCQAKTVIRYYYRSTENADIDLFSGPPLQEGPNDLAPGFKWYDPEGPRPADIVQTVTSDGRTVPYIVRREVGVINRAVYDIQFLHEPGQVLPTPWTHPTRGWNGKLVYLFDGGCGAGYHQGRFVGPTGMEQAPFLAEGYATATATLNRTENNCNDRVSAETLSMVKEHFIKQYGAPAHIIGWGNSGGAMELHLIAQNYPGLLDGIVPSVAFPDLTSTAQSVTDCRLLDNSFKISKQHWTEEQKTAVAGVGAWRTCTAWSSIDVADPRRLCASLLPQQNIYDRVANPQGLRCDIYDNAINFFGRDPRTGFARRPVDNVGVQYGLAAFNAGKIDGEHFLELNEHIGGLDEDNNIVHSRTSADPVSVGIAYERGLVLTGGGGLSEVPIIEWRPYTDDLGDTHDRFRSFVTRARLLAGSGNADNQVILVYPRPTQVDVALFIKTGRYDAGYAERERGLIRQMDQWLDNITADARPGTATAKVARNKPAELVDACWAANGEKIAEQASYDGLGRCNQLYPPHGDPRIAAGGPLTDDILKCTLKPIRQDDYREPLTAGQLQRLNMIFPTGVCDYSRPGIGQQITKATWQYGVRVADRLN